MARSASATDMISYDRADEAVPHGGDLDAARRQFPDAIEPFIDLSTGINPNPYPLPRFPAGLFARLPSLEAAATDLLETAPPWMQPARVYGPGTGTLMAPLRRRTSCSHRGRNCCCRWLPR